MTPEADAQEKGPYFVPDVHVDVHLDPHWTDRALRADVSVGLGAQPKELPPKWFYDEAGSLLFEEITRLDAYYPTEREREILRTHATDIVAAAGADTLVELGSGTSEKTRVLLDAMAAAGRLRRFVPFDVSEETLRRAAEAIAVEYPGVVVHGLVGDFDHHLDLIPAEGERMIALLGGTIGNLVPAERQRFLAEVSDVLRPGETFLLGTDLVKDPDRLVLAYDDPDGVTAAFNKNVLAVLNRELGADFDLEQFDHIARWDPEREWIEMLLRSRSSQQVRVAALDLAVEFDPGELMRTEISAKFRLAGVRDELEASGLRVVGCWTDGAGDYALTLARSGS
ncbi:MAG: L-histidine N(alpha)-methyltransferase [Acidimicrobiales bacterium]|nr:L-histidine N(alpha)-methyltransferase [Acidimicrobiales bacterium]